MLGYRNFRSRCTEDKQNCVNNADSADSDKAVWANLFLRLRTFCFVCFRLAFVHFNQVYIYETRNEKTFCMRIYAIDKGAHKHSPISTSVLRCKCCNDFCLFIL